MDWKFFDNSDSRFVVGKRLALPARGATPTAGGPQHPQEAPYTPHAAAGPLTLSLSRALALLEGHPNIVTYYDR